MKRKITSLLSEMVKINSVYPAEIKMALFIEKLLRKTGYIVTKQYVDSKRYNLIVEKGYGKKSVMLYSHLDTVGIVDGWKQDPFTLHIVGDKAYGIGAWDMKGGMAVSLLAFITHQPKNIKLKMVFCVDEENISLGGHVLARSPFIDDVECVISTEPAFFYGNQGIVIGRPGRAVYRINIEGKPKHYALYDPKEDISIFTGELIIDLKKINLTAASKKQFVFVRSTETTIQGMSTPQKIILELDSSILPPNSHSQILKKIKSSAIKINSKYRNYFTIDAGFVKRDTPFLEGYEIKKPNDYLKIMEKTIKKTTGKKAVPYFRSSIADENIFGYMGKTVLGIGAVGGNAHSYQEWVSLGSLEKLYNILTDFLTNTDNTI